MGTSQSWGGYPSPNRKAAEFAAAFAAYQGARFAIPTTSGTSALEVALKALGIGAGDEVIVPAITFAATPYAAVACMARPIFADVSAANACIDPQSVKRLITRRTKAIIPVHYGASLADLDAPAAISRAHSIPIVEDCAHVPGAQVPQSRRRHSRRSRMLQLSVLETDDRGRRWNDHDRRPRPRAAMPVAHQLRTPPSRRRFRRPADRRELPDDGMAMRNSDRATRAPARADRVQEPRRRPSARRTRRHQGSDPVGRDPPHHARSHLAFVFLVDESALGVSRNRFVRALRAEGIPCGVANDPVYRSALFPRESSPYRKAVELAGANPDTVAIDCPVAERLFEHAIVSIPHECLLGDDRDVDDIIAAAAKVASRASDLASANLK